MKLFRRVVIFLFALQVPATGYPISVVPYGAKFDTNQVPLPVKVVIVTMFEIGEDEGDQAGEFQLWKERQGLDIKIAFPHSHHDLFYNQHTQVLGVVTGIGTAKSASAIMALGLDSRFDLSKSYWIIAGIAGIDPEDASLGSAVWSSYIVDGDLAHEIDPREIPDNWDFGYFARYTTRPFDPNKPQPTGELFIANENLRDWANRWVAYWTDNKTDFVTSGMEDTGTLQSLEYLDRVSRADKNRVLVLRAGSNYTMQPPGVTAAGNLLRENKGFAGLEASLESLYIVGSKVLKEILDNWEEYEETIPGS